MLYEEGSDGESEVDESEYVPHETEEEIEKPKIEKTTCSKKEK